MPRIFYSYFPYLLLAVLLYFPVFGHLDTLPIRIWDEARQAINAYEMFRNGDFIVTHFEGNPDLWNTKPPLLIWMQVFFMKLIGVNELAVRLPSAFAAFFTCAAMMVFSLRYLKSFWFGFIAIVVLITSNGFINYHATRTGDYDALVTMFTTMSGLFFFSFCETRKQKHLYLFFAVTTLAVLAKSVTGLLFIPAIVVYSIMRKQLLPLLRNKHFYIGLFAAVAVVLSFYLIREAKSPGYLMAVYNNELGGRYLEVIEGHQHGFWFYFNNFIDMHLVEWYLLIPCGLVAGLAVKDERIRRLTVFAAVMSVTFFMVISIAQTKLLWYDVPLYPFLSFIIAVFIYAVFRYLKDLTWMNERLRLNISPYIFLFLFMISPYQKILGKTYKPIEHGESKEFYAISYFLKDAIRGEHNLNNHYLLYEGYHGHLLFYVNILNDQGVKVSFKDWKNLGPSDQVVVSQPEVRQYVEDHYRFEMISSEGNIIIYTITGEYES